MEGAHEEACRFGTRFTTVGDERRRLDDATDPLHRVEAQMRGSLFDENSRHGDLRYETGIGNE